MTDYIKREDAMELINKCVSHTSPKAEAIDFDFRHGEINGLNWASDIIEAMPSADVAPVRHGRWEKNDYLFLDTLYRCSVCGEEFYLENGTPQENQYNYCPNCGARMDGGEDDD